MLWLYLAPALAWMGTAYVLSAIAIVRHAIRVDSGGNLLALGNGPSSPGWWNVLQDAVFARDRSERAARASWPAGQLPARLR